MITSTAPDPRDQHLSAFISTRPRLFSIAYRMLGSAVEAEDIVQDVWLRWQQADRGKVENPRAFLITITTRLAINHARSARSRRETCAETWLLEPVDESAGPGAVAERGEALERAVALLLKELSASERTAFVLREAFNCSYPHIAERLHVSEVNSRQLVTRARKQLACAANADSPG